MRHLPIVAPLVMVGLFLIMGVGAQFLDDYRAPTWLKWLIGAPYMAFLLTTGAILAGGDVDDEDD